MIDYIVELIDGYPSLTVCEQSIRDAYGILEHSFFFFPMGQII